jgi:valyl-tRNA synthetase
MDKQYNHLTHEATVAQLWADHDCANPDKHPAATTTKSSRKTFTIIMPPPNANDPLHIGHAMFVALEDALVRFHRLQGDDTVWIPGTDHAGIETQFLFEKKLKKNDQSRFQFDRETLYQMIWDYVQKNSNIAIDQIKKLGASVDWSRYKFTLDPDIVKTVLGTFKKLADKKLIYRDSKLVNYCTKCGTAFSNLEVVHAEKASPLYYLKYGPFTLATTRPETKFGDTAVAVHPDDERYQQYIGQEIEVEGLNGPFKLKVIADSYVDPEFGTGVVKITPYHDFNDFLVWQRHKAELPAPAQVIDFSGRLTAVAGKYAGLKVAIAREQIAADLEAKGLLVKVNKDYQNSVGVCYRCGTAIEPLPLPQFYIKVKPLTEKVLAALDAGEVTVTGAGHDKILRHWLNNLDDWNISRQIVWGIRIPVWYDVSKNPDISTVFIDKSGQKQSGTVGTLLKTYQLSEIASGLQTLNVPITAEYVLSETAPGPSFIQETDTFDTWFSSSQWPFATLKNTLPGDFDRFYPTTVMETGYDILPFWVMRMLMMGLFVTGKVPFTQVYLHGLVRDQKGQKMSKSKGNVVNLLEITEKYGADALRMALVIRSSAGLDKSVGEADFKAMRNLTNKLWNAARYLTMNLSATEIAEAPGDAAFRKKLIDLKAQIAKNLTKLQIGLAAETAYNEFWHWYCDEAIEQAKTGKLSQTVLLEGLIDFLKLLHPFMPFVTEAIWQQLKTQQLVADPYLITSQW